MSKIAIENILNNIKVLNDLKTGYSLSQTINDEIKTIIKSNINFNKKIKFQKKSLSLSENIKKNFFSYLMISSLSKIGIHESRVIEYGKIIFGLRTIITATDNIIDNENKGIVFIEGQENIVVRNTLLIMLGQQIVQDALINLGDINLKTMFNILEKIYLVANSESIRDSKLYSSYPKPDYISKNIHSGIGGQLLVLSLIAPLSLEKDISILRNLKKLEDSLYKIGIALQELDDFSDIEEDFNSDKVNLAISQLFYEFSTPIDINIVEVLSKVETNYFKIKYLKNVNDTAIDGFKILAELGYSLNEKEIIKLLKFLYKIRGLGEYWDLYELTISC